MTTKKTKSERYDTEIQNWLYGGVKTPSRFKKFYESMISIHLGGEGLMEMFNKEIEKNPREAKLIYRNYKINSSDLKIEFTTKVK